MITHSPHRTILARIRDERGNCFLYGCVTLVVLALIGGLIAFILGRSFVREVREKYTETAPLELPTVEMPADQIQALIARVDAYAADLRADKAVPSLSLSETEVNALLQNHPDLKDIYGGLMYVALEEGGVTGNMSVALDWFPGMHGRFFNGTATFDVSLRDDDPDIRLVTATVKGETVPEEYLVQLRTEDFADRWDHEPDARALIRKIESVKIEKGTVTLIPKTKADSAEVPPTEAPVDSAAPAPPAA